MSKGSEAHEGWTGTNRSEEPMENPNRETRTIVLALIAAFEIFRPAPAMTQQAALAGMRASVGPEPACDCRRLRGGERPRDDSPDTRAKAQADVGAGDFDVLGVGVVSVDCGAPANDRVGAAVDDGERDF